jgi:methylase of polypeptide subunit release factors
MRNAGVLEGRGSRLRSTVRVSSVDDLLYIHSAPTSDANAVFLGPDSYRFVRFLHQVLAPVADAGVALDIGVGAGVGAMTVARFAPGFRVWGSDPNPDALRFCRVNARHAGLEVSTLLGEGLEDAPQGLDLIVTNPPYIAGEGGRLYRDGGDHHGAALALEWVREGVTRLNPGGRFVLYTGSAIVEGGDYIKQELQRLALSHGMGFSYEELDPDVFGESLRQDAYREVERIAAVGAVLTRRR